MAQLDSLLKEPQAAATPRKMKVLAHVIVDGTFLNRAGALARVRAEVVTFDNGTVITDIKPVRHDKLACVAWEPQPQTPSRIGARTTAGTWAASEDVGDHGAWQAQPRGAGTTR